MKATKERIAKLPAWARLHIQRLESDLRDAEEAVNVALGENADQATGVITVNSGLNERGIRQNIALPDHATVQFHFGSHVISMHRSLDNPCVQVYSNPGQIFTNPRAANALYLLPENAFERNKMVD